MPKRTSKKSRDVNELAAGIVEAATSDDAPQYEELAKNPHAVALGRLGGKKGGAARGKKLSAKKRSDIARKAANTRWSKRQS
jgi:hypothetical protein